MGEPSPVRIVELGPGRGTLMADALRVIARVPPLAAAMRLHLVETSEALRERQRATLSAAASLALTWHAAFDEVPEGPTILVANEFFDALPIRQYVRLADGWHERLVGVREGDRLAFGLAGEAEAALAVTAPEGAIVEVCPGGAALAAAIARRVAAQGGAALIVDYGHRRSAAGETLQALRRHAFADPLAEPGEADLTAHVDFAMLAGTARREGAAVHGPVTQGEFLRALGIEARAARLRSTATPAQAAAIEAALARLTGMGEGGMGALFKAMAIAHPGLGALAGF
jgi:SAM-dependent MidA family methyltransferase